MTQVNIWRRILTTLLMLPAVGAWGQGSSKELPKIVPPGPTTAALGKYVETPVSTYTGVPNISIPLYEIKARDITVPIGLSYHAGGIRVEEEASWVGLGWSLQAGGVVGRTIRGRDDFSSYIGYHESFMPVFLYPGYSSACSGSELLGDKDHPAPNYCSFPPSDDSDWEPDAFFFNFLGHSGKFVFDQQGVPHLLEQAKIKIVWRPAEHGFIIGTPDGFRYEFYQVEMRLEGAVAWHLSKIISPQGEQVVFTYEREQVSTYTVHPRSEVKNIETTGGCSPGLVDDNSTTVPTLSEPYLSRIDFSTGYITFERDAQAREDIKNADKLKYIRVYQKAYQRGVSLPFREFELVSSYFISPTERRGEENHSISDEEHLYAGKRLRLDEVIERGGGQAKPSYRLTYSAKLLPYKTSNNCDHWGFFNGAHNASLIPGYEGFSPLSQAYVKYDGADREPNAQACLANMLVKIQYPTGGKTSFEYAINDYGNMHKDDLYPWAERTITASERAFSNGTLDTQPPSVFNIAPGDVPTNATPVVLYLQLQRSCAQGQNCNGQTGEDNGTYVQIRQLDGPLLIVWSMANTGIGYFTKQVMLPPGRYELSAKASVNSAWNKYAWGQLNIRDKVFSPIYTKVGGGVRIAAVRSDNGLGQNSILVRKYRYDQEVVDSLGTHRISQGILMSRPRYHRYVERPYKILIRYKYENVPIYGINICRAFQLCSYSSSQLSGSAQGAVIGYSRVEEIIGEQGEGGKTVYQYENAEDIAYDYWQRPPGIPNISYKLNGYLRSQSDYRTDAGHFKRVKESTNAYDVSKEEVIRGAARGPMTRILEQDLDPETGSEFVCAACDMPIHKYIIYSRLIQKVNTTERLYDPKDDTRSWQKSTDYVYDIRGTGHLQVSQMRTTQSNGSVQLTELTYPADYTQVSSGPLVAMRSEDVFQHAAVVETTSSILTPGQSVPRLTSGQYTEYSRPNSGSAFLPTTKYELELAKPIAGLGVAAPSLPPAGRYVAKAEFVYESSTANLKQMNRTSDVPTTFLWGYDQTQPVAQIQNASAEQVTVALQALGVAPTALPTSDVALRQLMAQLRQRLPQARITSFTYQVLVGMISQTDPAGRTMFYEYDELGRLIRTRDEQGRILSQQQYHYVQP